MVGFLPGDTIEEVWLSSATINANAPVYQQNGSGIVMVYGSGPPWQDDTWGTVEDEIEGLGINAQAKR